MLILAIIVGGMAVGWIAQFLLGRNSREIDWRIAFLAGIGGSFVGGLLASLIAGDGLALRPSGIIGSIVGAVVITLAWQQVNKKASGGRARGRQQESRGTSPSSGLRQAPEHSAESGHNIEEVESAWTANLSS